MTKLPPWRLLEGEEVESFARLGSNVEKLGGTDVKVRVGKARAAFHRLKNVWESS